MKITLSAYNKLYNFISKVPPECGGILGSSNNSYITNVILDKNESTSKIACYYEPNVSYLNKCIEKWSDNGIYFKGVFHTHFSGVKTLSNADIKYISDIMNNMPEEINNLYFPIFVIPNMELVVYKASRKGEKIEISFEDICFI